MKIQAKIGLFFICFILLFTVGCGKQSPTNNKNAYLTIEDDLGRKVVLEKKPERIVCLSASFIEPIHDLHGEIVGVPNSHSLPKYAEAIPKVGAVYNINLEKVISLKPDLVIGIKGINDKLVSSLKENNIPIIIMDIKTYEQVKNCVRVFGKITGNEMEANGLNEKMDKEMMAIKEKLPEKLPKIAILHSTSQDVTVQLNGSIAGSIAKILGFTNVAINKENANKNIESAPYSLEALVKENPEYIFVTSMGERKSTENTLAKETSNNSAWQTLSAVKENHVFDLPQKYFLLSPGLDYPKAALIMVKKIYPNIFK